MNGRTQFKNAKKLRSKCLKLKSEGSFSIGLGIQQVGVETLSPTPDLNSQVNRVITQLFSVKDYFQIFWIIRIQKTWINW
jgi:hypothetical protein